MDAVQGQRLGRYEVSRALASGSMADLLLATARGLEGFERHVVIKRLRAEAEADAGFREMFIVEARLAAALHHSNIVQVHDVGEEDGKPYIVMEYLHGEDLRRVLAKVVERGVTVPLPIVVAIVTSVARALHHAHEQLGTDQKPLEIVHRDVSPGNIVVGYDGNVKVLDFGIARAAMRRLKTQATLLRGKAPYLAPEQCTGAKVDRRSDVFGLGVVMYELLTARRLFKAENDFSTMRLITRGTFPPPSEHRPDMPRVLEAIVMKALSRSASIRHQTALELCEALEKVATDQKWQTSPGAVASYMTELFGTRAEPWVSAEPPPPVSPVDFDGDRAGLAKGPPESGPIMIPSRTAKSTSTPAPKPEPEPKPEPTATTPEANPFAEEDKPSSIVVETPVRGVKVTGPPQIEVSGEVTQNLDVADLIEEPAKRVEVRTDVVKPLPPPRPAPPPKPAPEPVAVAAVVPVAEATSVPVVAPVTDSPSAAKSTLGNDETAFVAVGRRPKWVVPAIIGGALVLAIVIGAIAMSGDNDALLAATPAPAYDAPPPLLALDAAEVAIVTPDAAEPLDAPLDAEEVAVASDAELADAPEEVAVIDAGVEPDAAEEVAITEPVTKPTTKPVTKPTVKPTTKPVKKPTKPPVKPTTKPNWNPNKLFPTKK